jgi:hypothetical protein
MESTDLDVVSSFSALISDPSLCIRSYALAARTYQFPKAVGNWGAYGFLLWIWGKGADEMPAVAGIGAQCTFFSRVHNAVVVSQGAWVCGRLATIVQHADTHLACTLGYCQFLCACDSRLLIAALVAPCAFRFWSIFGRFVNFVNFPYERRAILIRKVNL